MGRGRRRRGGGGGPTPPALSPQQPPAFRQTTLEARYEGPLPLPGILGQYNDVVPNGAEQIMRMAEEQATHRIALESKVIASDVWRANAGLGLGFIIAIVFGAIAWDLIRHGFVWAGSGIAVTDLTALVGTFVYGTQARRRQLIEQREEAPRRRR